jgi:predicted phage terminase large subunit-like protein
MSRTTKPAPLRQPTLEVRLPALHPKQLEVFQNAARFKVVVCGRQWGKTALGAVMCVTAALRGKDVWWVAPSYPLAEHAWRYLHRLSVQIPGVRFQEKPIYRITFPTGGTIQLKSADNPDSLRGATLDGVVFDEAAQAKAEAWPTLEPTLAIRRGWAMFISTPKGLNWFQELYEEAGKAPGWERWRFPSSSSPYFQPEELALAKARHSSLFFSQEYEAEFISAALGLFKAVWFRYWHPDGTNYVLGQPENVVAAKSCRRFATVDLAWSVGERADYTVISNWALSPTRHLILLGVTRGRFEGPDIVPLMSAAYKTYKLGYLVVERATRQTSIIQEAVRTGLPIKVVRPEKDKVARAIGATARMEQGTVWFPKEQWVKDLEQELLAFPFGQHDDFVDTLAYAVRETALGGSYLAKVK